jgi:uncharacterized protein YukE
MGVRTFPALGFDPAPGSPAALLAQAREADRAARALAGAATAAGLLDAGWQGGAADAFREQARDLPRDLQHAAAAHGALARELTAYADDLASRQLRAGDLESRAAALRQAGLVGARVGRGLVSGAAVGPGTALGSDAAVGSGAAVGPGTAVGPGAAELAAVLADARRLLVEHRDAAARSAARIRAAASDPPYHKPGLAARIWDSVRGWVSEHADVLSRIAGDLRGVSAVLGTASLVPGFQFLAPVAIATGAVAVGIDVLVAASTGRGSWPGLALDTALTVLPTGPVARTVRTVPGVGRALKAANRAVPAGVRGRIFRAVRNLPEGISADQLAAAAARIRSGAGGLTGDVVVQGSRAGHSARAASDIDFGLRVTPAQYDKLIQDCFGETPTGEAAANAVTRGRIFWRHAGLKELRNGLQSDLGRKVDLAIIKRGGLFDNEPWLRVP